MTDTNRNDLNRLARDNMARTVEKMGLPPGTQIFSQFLRRKPLAGTKGKPLQGLRGGGKHSHAPKAKASRPPWMGK